MKELRPYQVEAVEQFTGRGNQLLALVMGAGKGHPPDTPVLTPTGWKPLQDLRVGSEVIGSSGTPIKVTGVFPRGVLPTYEVSFKDNTSLEVDGDHLWYVESPAHRHRGMEGEVLTTRLLADPEGKAPSRSSAPASQPEFQTYVKDRHGNHRWSVPSVAPVQFKDNALVSGFDAYTLGALLGDGGLTLQPKFTTHVEDWPHFREQMLLDWGEAKPDYRRPSVLNISIRGARHGLRTLDLYGKRSWEKHVPLEYLLAAPFIRLAVLQGLMDTDGYAMPTGGSEFSTSSPQLAEDAAFLARTLGGQASIKWRTTKRRDSARVNIKLPPGVPLFRLPRKVAAYVSPTKYPPCKVMTDVKLTGEAKEIICISVDAPDQLYVVEGVTLTHNTATAIRGIRQLRRERQVNSGLIFSLKSTKLQWEREIHEWDPRASVQVVDGDKYQRHRALNRAWQYNYTILHYECLVNDWFQIMGGFPDGVDFVVADECTVLKNFGAKRSKRAKRLGRQTPYRIGLSGAPVENRPEELFSIMEFIDPEVLGGFDKFDRTFIVRDRWGKPERYRNLDMIPDLLDGVMYRKSREDIKQWMPTLIETEMPVKLDYKSQALHDHIKSDLAESIEAALGTGVSGGSFDLAAHYGQYENDKDMQQMGQVMARMLAMRMVSSHPQLLTRSAKDFDDPLSAAGSQYAATVVKKMGAMPKTNAKFDALIDTIEEILDEDPKHKVVVFSFFKHMLSLMQDEFKKKGWGNVRIDGDVKTADRDKSIVAFNEDPDTRIFISSDAGAYGVDLNRGSHLICYDLPWSAGALSQRVARIDRTSNEFDQIQVIYLFGQGTIEERMLRMLRQKSKVAKAFIDKDFDQATGTMTLDLESLREFVSAA